MSDKIILSVYFSGTGHPINHPECLASLLSDVTEVDAKHLKMGFNGCQVDYGFSGMLFGTGLEEQCKKVVEIIIPLLKAGKRIRLNAYGHSRGAIACLMLAKMLGHFDRDLIEVNLALMDPVPGNFLTTAALDFTHRTLARQTMDVSQCRNLVNVLAIYPHTPLLNIEAHAPLIPQYPAHCNVTEEIIPGCHAGAQKVDKRHHFHVNGANRGSDITLRLVSRFLAKLGTLLRYLNPQSFSYRSDFDSYVLDDYNKSIRSQRDKAVRDKINHTSRECHAKSSLRIETNWPASYLTPTHKALQLNTPSLYPEDKLEVKEEEKLHEFAYSFQPANHQTKKTTIKKIPAMKVKEKTALFIQFLEEIYITGMSSKSQKSTKGKLLEQCIKTLRNTTTIKNQKLLKDAMRNALAICLQRDRFSISLFSTTHSGNAAVTLLRSKKYAALSRTILNTSKPSMRYRDLRGFVLGRNDEAYFNAKHASSLYQFFQPESKNDIESARTEKPRLLANNMKRYLP
jgi:hypothetical protein